MRTIQKNLVFTIIALLMLDCSKGDDESLLSNAITIDASVKSLTRGASESFNDEDVVRVYAWTGDNSVISNTSDKNYTYSSSSSTWYSEDPLTWADLTTDYYFMGVYPARDITDFTTDSYTLDVSDQESADLLIATNVGGCKGSKETPISLIFNHVMAKLTINLSYKSEFLDTPTVNSVELSAGKTGTINYLNKTVTLTGESEVISIPAVKANTKYASVMIPQTIGDIVIKIDDKSYTYSPDTAIELKSGKHYILNLTVGQDGEVKLNFSINEWETEDGNGEALEFKDIC